MTGRIGLIWMMMAFLVASGTITASGQSTAPQPSKSAPASTSIKKSADRKVSKRKAGVGDELIFTPPSSDRYENSFRLAPKHFLFDQKAMWTSPAHVGVPEATWLVPVAGVAAGFFATDSGFSRQLSHSTDTLNRYRHISDYGIGAMAGAAGGAYLLGLATHNEHQRETGFLSGEAAVDSLVATEAIKYMTRRERPLVDNANGQFWNGGDSFPSEHSAAAWSIAGIVAHEYPSLPVKLLAYGAATAVSVSRIKAEQHFPSDVLVGSALGWLISHYVYGEHHNPDLAGGPWELIGIRPDRPEHWQAKSMGSPYVPLDSWIYPALLRLAALGYIQSDIEGMRPWTRMECARLVEEAGDNLEDNESAPKLADNLYSSLEREFAQEINLLGGGDNARVRLESVYTRVTGISGQPLTDGFNFGQTIINDNGRPYEEGFNNVSGFSGWASDGPFVAYMQGEYQHAPSAPALALGARQFIAGADGPLPVPPGTDTPAVNHFQLLDAYVAMNFENWQLSFGKQSLWWGPSEGGPMLFSDNAAPVEMLRLNRVTPFRLPSVLSWMGPIRLELFLGQLSGHEFMDVDNTNLVGQWGRPLGRQPFIHGEKLSFKPTSNFEFGVSETTVFAGGPIPLNGHNLIRSYAGFIVPVASNAVDITDARSGIDFTYRVPWVRKWLTFYGDAFSEDEFSPLAYPRKSAFQGGIYMPRIPGIPKLDLRVEGGSTSPVDFAGCNGCFYQNGLFVNSYTNSGNLMGTWVGRASQGEQAWATYWLTSKNTIQFNYRHRKVDSQFMPNGGTVNDGGVKADIWLNATTELSGALQNEKWTIPTLTSTPQTNWSSSLEITYWPRAWGKSKDAAK
ncbi:MAG: capsule assembly Wzi family protein [Candidatus Acidiferrales bacterium]